MTLNLLVPPIHKALRRARLLDHYLRINLWQGHRRLAESNEKYGLVTWRQPIRSCCRSSNCSSCGYSVGFRLYSHMLAWYNHALGDVANKFCNGAYVLLVTQNVRNSAKNECLHLFRPADGQRSMMWSLSSEISGQPGQTRRPASYLFLRLWVGRRSWTNLV